MRENILRFGLFLVLFLFGCGGRAENGENQTDECWLQADFTGYQYGTRKQIKGNKGAVLEQIRFKNAAAPSAVTIAFVRVMAYNKPGGNWFNNIRLADVENGDTFSAITYPQTENNLLEIQFALNLALDIGESRDFLLLTDISADFPPEELMIVPVLTSCRDGACWAELKDIPSSNICVGENDETSTGDSTRVTNE